MQTIATIVGLASGLALMRLHKAPVDMIATSLVVDAALAPLTAIVASRRGRSATFWTIAGFALGMWALAYVLIVMLRRPIPPARPENPVRPPPADAA